VTLTFPAGSALLVKVLDGSDKKTEITDYRWIIEEDRTFYIDPNCTIARLALPHNSPLGAADAFDQARWSRIIIPRSIMQRPDGCSGSPWC